MTPWAIAPAQWATWTQEEAVAKPAEALDAFDAEVARRLEAAGFAANLEQTSVTSVTEPHPSESDATLIRPSPDLVGGNDFDAPLDEFGDAAVTMVHAAAFDPEEEEEDADGEGDAEPVADPTQRGSDTADVLEVGLEAPNAELRVELDSAAHDDPNDEGLDGLVLPSLTMPPSPEPEPEPEPELGGGTVVAPAPLAPSGRTVVAPAPTEPAARVGKTLVPIDATEPPSHMRPLDPASPGGTEVAPVTPIQPPARTGDTLPPISDDQRPRGVPAADAKTSEAAASSSGVFRTIDIHDDEDPEPPPARQKVVVGVPAEAEPADTSEIDADAFGEEDDEDELDVALVPAEPPAPKPETPPPPRKEQAKKPPPAPKARPAEAPTPPELPVETRLEPRVLTPTGPHNTVTPRAPGWPEEVFAEHFVAMTRPHHAKLAKAEVEFFVQSTGIQPGARVLDVGCGDGTHALVMGQRGFSVTALDISPAQLARAERAREALGAPATFVHGDMRDMPVEGPFEAVFCVGTSFGYYDDEENRAVLRAMAGMLTPGGRLLLHVFNRDHIIGRLPTRSWWQGHGCLVLDEAQMNFFTNRLAVHRTIVFEDGRQYEHRLQIRGYNAHELGRMCVDAGLRIVEISGDRNTRGRFYGASSADIWLVLEPTT